MLIDSMDYLRCPACIGELALTAEEQNETEVAKGILKCGSCEKCFEINDGLPNLIFPEMLEESDLQQQMRFDREPKYDFRPRAFVLGIWESAFCEGWVRRKRIGRLELQNGASVLEIGVGTGKNLPIIHKLIGEDGRIEAMDISSGTLKVARKRLKAQNIHAELVQANASYLPYESEQFDGVLQIGAFSEFADKKRALEEMHRVAKPGAKIIICDEGLRPGKEKTLWGRWILKFIPSFADKPPVGIFPADIEELKVSWIQRGTHWLVEFRKKR